MDIPVFKVTWHNVFVIPIFFESFGDMFPAMIDCPNNILIKSFRDYFFVRLAQTIVYTIFVKKYLPQKNLLLKNYNSFLLSISYNVCGLTIGDFSTSSPQPSAKHSIHISFNWGCSSPRCIPHDLHSETIITPINSLIITNYHWVLFLLILLLSSSCKSTHHVNFQVSYILIIKVRTISSVFWLSSECPYLY